MQHLTETWKTFLVAMLNDCLAKENTPEAWKESTLILIPKEGNLKKTRPIALLEPCRRLLSKLLNNRLDVYFESRGGLPGSVLHNLI